MFGFDWFATFLDGLVPGWGTALAGLALIVAGLIVWGSNQASPRLIRSVFSPIHQAHATRQRI